MTVASLRILVTGCAGFIGWKVTERLLDEGHTVVGVDSLEDGLDIRLKEWRLDQLKGRPGFTFYRADVESGRALNGLIEGRNRREEILAGDQGSFRDPSSRVSPPLDAVIHLAAKVGIRKSVENPWAYFETNVKGTLNLLELCQQVGVTKFILASSSSVYGDDNPRPVREDADTSHSRSPYAASKKAAEVLCHTYHRLWGLDVTILRYFTVYGPGGRPDMSPFRFVQRVIEGWPVMMYGDGTQERDFTYVDDIARGTAAAVKSGGYEVVNLGSSRPVSLNDFLGLIEELAGSKAIVEYKPRREADVMATWADISKAEKLLGWQPRVGLGDGLTRLVEWYQQNRHWANKIRN